MEYTIIAKDDKKEFVDTVNKYIDNGWIPCGGVNVLIDKNLKSIFYHQAMTRDE